MFNMIVENQMNLIDRTVVLGKPNFDKIPKKVKFQNRIINVKGISKGVAPPFLSLEIDKIEENLVGEMIIAII